jgi:hypothetical protein
VLLAGFGRTLCIKVRKLRSCSAERPFQLEMLRLCARSALTSFILFFVLFLKVFVLSSLLSVSVLTWEKFRKRA